jgi:hypothetical protein
MSCGWNATRRAINERNGDYYANQSGSLFR